MWTYGLKLLGSSRPSKSYEMQSLQSIILHKITDCISISFVSNYLIHNNRNVAFVKDHASAQYKSFYCKLETYSNLLGQSFSSPHNPGNPEIRLKRKWSRDLLDNEYLFLICDVSSTNGLFLLFCEFSAYFLSYIHSL